MPHTYLKEIRLKWCLKYFTVYGQQKMYFLNKYEMYQLHRRFNKIKNFESSKLAKRIVLFVRIKSINIHFIIRRKIGKSLSKKLDFFLDLLNGRNKKGPWQKKKKTTDP